VCSLRKNKKAYMDRVANLGCVVCKTLFNTFEPAQVHHIREGQGMAQRASDWLIVPLCPACHTGPQGLHGDRSMMRIAKLEELDLLALTIEALHEA